MRKIPFWADLFSDISVMVGLASTLLFAGPELMARAGWWPKPLLMAMIAFWGLVFWLRSAVVIKNFSDSARGDP